MTIIAENIDSYTLSHLVHHLARPILIMLERDPQAVEIRYLEALHGLMTEPAWMDAHVAEDGHYASFLNEIQMAWRVADKAGEVIEQLRPKMIGCQVRYALLQTSVNSLASNMLPEMLLAGIQMGRWKVEAVLAYAKQMTHGMTKVTMLIQIAAFLHEQREDELAQEALINALVGLRDLDSSTDFVEALIALVPHLTPDLLTDAFFLAQEIPSEDDCMRVVCKLLPRLPPELQDEVLELIEESGSSEKKALAIAEVAQNLPAYLFHHALEIIRQVRIWPKAQAKALVALSSCLPTQLIPDALVTAEAIENPLYKTAALMAFPQFGDPEKRLAMVRQSLITPWDSLDVDDRAEGIMLLAPYLPSELSHEVFMLALNLGAGEFFGGLYRTKALEALGPHLPPKLQTQLIDIISKSPFDLSWIDILAALAQHLPQELLPMALVVARKLIQKAYAEEDLPDFVPNTIPKALVKLFPRLQLDPDLMSEALATLSEIKAADARCFALAELVPYLPESLLSKALTLAEDIIEPWDAVYHALPLTVLSLHGFPSAFDSALEIVGKAQYGDESVVVLPVLLAGAASICSSTQRSVFMDEAIASARNIVNQRYRSQALSEIAKLIPELRRTILDEAYKAANEIQLPYERMIALSRLIPSLSSEERCLVKEQLMTLSQAFAHRDSDDIELDDDTELQDALLLLFTPFLSGGQAEIPSDIFQSSLSDEQVQSFIDIAQHLGGREYLEVLVNFALYLPNLSNNQHRTIAVKALEFAENVDASDHYNLGISLARLVPVFPPDLYSSALALAQKIQSPHALAAFVPYASEEERQCVLDEALTVAGIRATGEKVNIPTTLVPYLLPYLTPHQQMEALQTALAELQQIPFPTNWEYFRQTLRPIAKAWARLPYQQAYALWTPTLLEYAMYRRQHFLAALSELLPVIRALGSTAAVIETINAVLEVCRQWSWSLRSPQPST